MAKLSQPVQFINKQMFPSHTEFKILDNKIVFRTFLNVLMLSDAVSLTENDKTVPVSPIPVQNILC